MRRAAALSDQTKIASVSALCLMGLIVVLKNVLDVSPEVLSRDVIFFIPTYFFFGWFPSIYDRRVKKSKLDRPLLWSLVILALTFGIIIVYAV
ncbi:MAG: hypothetical protein ABSG55_10885 [Dehalococcoidia bacterium]|jgi:hypothetical protein